MAANSGIFQGFKQGFHWFRLSVFRTEFGIFWKIVPNCTDNRYIYFFWTSTKHPPFNPYGSVTVEHFERCNIHKIQQYRKDDFYLLAERIAA